MTKTKWKKGHKVGYCKNPLYYNFKNWLKKATASDFLIKCRFLANEKSDITKERKLTA